MSSHQYGEAYSGRIPVPTILQFDDDFQTNEDKDLPPTPAVYEPSNPANENAKTDGKPRNEKQEMMDKLQPSKKEKPIDAAAKAKGEYWQRDPITADEVLVKNSNFSDFRNKGLDNKSMDPSQSQPGPSLSQPRPIHEQDYRKTTPALVDVGNICLQQFPPPIETTDVSHVLSILREGAQVTTAGCLILWYFVALGDSVSWFTLFFRTGLLASIVALSWIGVEGAGRKIEKELQRIRMNMHTQRGKAFSPPTPESVEWLNAILKVVWGLVNPEMFAPIVDMIEDILQASLPGMVDAVRISDIGQGTNPLRIVSMRALPDQPGHPDYPRDDWAGLDSETQEKLKKAAAAKFEKHETISEEDETTDQTGDYLNYEISVSYQAEPGQSKTLRLHNMHLMLEFFVGLYDWFKIPIPFFAVVEGFVATVRLRVQFIRNPPFVRNLTISLMGLPEVSVSAEPFTTKLPNVLDLPLIQKFVEMGIAAACAQYIAPHSLTVNIAQLLAGDGIKKDTYALGIIVVVIHHAVDLSAQDESRSSDPYIVLAYAKFGKPLYSTRIILGDLNPVWEETAFLLVTPDEVKGDEQLSATLWDSDKRTADDLVGKVAIPLMDVMKNPGKMQTREDSLQSFQDANEMPGKLFWEVGYFKKAPLNQDLKKIGKQADDSLPADAAQAQKEKSTDKPTVVDTKDEADVLAIPPDPSIPSGILSVIVHKINNLERQNISGNTGDREGQAGQDASGPTESGDNLPNSYVEIILNDDMIYKSRVKQATTNPYFETGTERFIRDWRNAVVRVQVRDARTREKDPVLGVVTVRLIDILAESSEVTRLFSLQEGVGYGRVNISFLFRQVKLDLPRSMLGWETGTVEILGSVRIEPTAEYKEGFRTKKLQISTNEESYKTPSRSATIDADGNGSVTWDLPTEKVRFPVYDRYSSAVTFEIGSGGFGFIGNSSNFVALLWLKDIVDDEEIEVRLPVVKSSKLSMIRQNYVNDQLAKTHKYDIVGYLTCTLILDSGLDKDHEKYQDTRPDKHRYEAYDRVEGQAKTAERNAHATDDGVIDSTEQKDIEREKTHQLNMRHRGVMQYKSVRTAVWSKEGIAKRAKTLKNSITASSTRQPTVESEA